MSNFRFNAGAFVMCNLGPDGWKLGRIIALSYREAHWPVDVVAPYQVMLEADQTLIYVPQDDEQFCREATDDDFRIARRMDALAPLPATEDASIASSEDKLRTDKNNDELACSERGVEPGDGYRHGRCHCCNRCPRDWSYVELYSEHYRCAGRNQLKVTRQTIDLGRLRVGQAIQRQIIQKPLPKDGYGQAPTLIRLPPGLTFSDDGTLSGTVGFDPTRGDTYKVDFVAVSTAAWRQSDIGLVRVEVSFVVEDNAPPLDFDSNAFTLQQQQARVKASRIVNRLYDVWTRWEHHKLSNRATCDYFYAELRDLRAILEVHPRLDAGRWWVKLGGFHMNIHKLLENALFECELYLGYALTFGDAAVRRMAEQNLKGCYQKRLLEAARFIWYDGLQQMMDGHWHGAVETMQRAAAKNDGWGWAVNYGDIWLAEAVARIVCGVSGLSHGENQQSLKTADWLNQADQLISRTEARAGEAGVFGPDGHPWAAEVRQALYSYRDCQDNGDDVASWLDDFKLRTHYWCAQVLSGTPPFPPKVRSRIDNADTLVRRLIKITIGT
ncbi:MAG: hypothetical protein VYA30_07010 [Myxococcota bacterium]|nr:hypothetical protein [Myxococcota bacterium]